MTRRVRHEEPKKKRKRYTFYAIRYLMGNGSAKNVGKRLDKFFKLKKEKS